MTVAQFQVPRLDVADRILDRLDLSVVHEEHFLALMRSAGFTQAGLDSRLTVREQVAFLVNSLGESEVLQRLLELTGEAGVAEDESPASVEFQIHVADAIRQQADRYQVPDSEVLPGPVAEIAYGPICTLCGHLDVQLHPWVTISGELLVQWRRGGADYVARVYESPRTDHVLLELETAERQEVQPFSVEALSAFVRYGVC